ncbi:hypothetical protein GCM10010174_89890 [Kutzneria viridogrisea]|uniref:Uncharacterized protein n=2 Tax=Kutzneria TaxID=43356 RepID=W5WH06_9PSEU|nr:hypothetical protein [Kutzneria albida]AHH99876.1 hypothetical protein KALB_6517 [Kutzneria albida DSM 43870]MBA8925056.1 murein DD-endopeptidase MepM/ murein hydrolase activator NlpD [Kutzneria viridogrisea]
MIQFEGQEIVHLAKGTYRWVDIKRFRCDGAPRDLLAELIAHPQYRDHYAGPPADEQGEHSLHGPYRLEAITVDSFEPTTPVEACRVLRAWTDDPALDRVYPMLDNGTVHALRATVHHEWGWVVGGLGGFHEFVVIAPPGLTLIVASDD